MELVYLWTQSYRNIENSGFNFSRNFHVEFVEGNTPKIAIHQLQNSYNLFGEKIHQITAIIGKNGSGKTNILDILGAKRESRLNFGSYKKTKYFLIYHLEGNLFAIEGSNFDLIKDSLIKNLNMEKQFGQISEPYSIVIESKDGKLYIKNYLQNTNFRNSIDFFNFRHRYSGEAFQHINSMKIEEENSLLFKRINLSPKNTGSVAIYQMILDLNNIGDKESREFNMFNFNNEVYISIYSNLHINPEIKLNLKKGFNRRMVIKRNFPNERPTFESKQSFINKFLYDYCHSLASNFLILPKMESDYSKLLSTIDNKMIVNEEYVEYYLEVIEHLLDFQAKKDKYFKSKEQILSIIKSFINLLDKFDLSWFDKEKIVISLKGKSNTNLKEFLKLNDDLEYLEDELQYLLKVFNINFAPFSVGEEALMSLFASLHHGLALNFNQNKETAILLLDEPDNFMHPEWSRLIIKELFGFLNNLENGYKNYQLIITTHSPFIVSDLPRDNVIALDKDKNTGICTQKTIEETFAANIHTLLAQEFFMTSTIGEYAKYKINYVINLLNKPSESLSLKDRQEIEYIIDIIGEPLIKNKLKIMAEKTLWKDITIAKLKARILELESNDSDK